MFESRTGGGRSLRFARVIAVLSAFAITLSLAASALAMEYPPTAGEHRLTTNSGEQSYPAIWGSKVVYTDWRNYSKDIYLFDFSTGTEKRLTTNAYDQLDPDICGNYVVWEDRRYAGSVYNSDIYLYNLTTGVEKRITPTSVRVESQPAIYGNYVVYTAREKFDNGDNNIWVYNIVTNTSRKLTTSGLVDWYPDIWGTKVVYQAERTDTGTPNYDIVCYDLSASSATTITMVNDQEKPSIYGNYVVFEDYPHGNENSDIYFYNLSSGAKKAICTDPAIQYAPVVYGNRIAWEEHRNDAADDFGDVYTYDLSTGVTERISTTGDQYRPAIYGSWVVWEDWRDHNLDIYLYETKPSVVLKAPAFASTFYVDKPQYVWSFLSPRHTAGTKQVKIYRWKKDSEGNYESRGYYWATASDYSTYSKVTTRIEFPSTGEWKLKAFAPGDALHAPTYSAYNYFTVKDVTVGTPYAPETMGDDTLYTVKGTLKPRHTEGTKPIRIYKWKKVDGEWVEKGYSTATVYDYSSYSQYKKKMEFSSAGKWRLRALHPEDSKHRKRWSSNYEYVTVTN
jgi:beta propeller repeat protein